LVDPPFEKPDELERVSRALLSGLRKWPTGIFVVWFPLKDRSASSVLEKSLLSAKIPRCLSAEFLRFREDGKRLAGSGMLFCNPPWGLDNAIRSLSAELLAAFNALHGSWSVEWLSGEPT
jgi:23S rRNA (adenine2030-N6)-methyltransferase